jgi:hypothetical protein
MKLLNHKKNKRLDKNPTFQSTSLQSHSYFLLLLMLFLCRESKAQALDVEVDDPQINAVTFYTFTININPGALVLDIPQGSSVAITFPSDYDTDLLRSLTLPGYDSSKSYSCLDPVPDCSSITILYSGSTFIFSGFFQNTILASDGLNNPLVYTLNNIKNPSFVKTTGTFLLTIFKGAIIYGTASGVNITLSLRSTLPYSLSVVDTTIYAISPLTITFIPTVQV